MKKIFVFLLVLLFAFSMTSCAQNPAAEQTELTVFAAASLTESLSAIADAYMAKNKSVTINFNFDSSGKLLRQITEGASCDLFLSAAPKQMDELEAVGALSEGTRLNLLENKVVLATAQDSENTFAGFADLAGKLQAGEILLAIGNEDVPVGQYTQKIFAYYGIDEAAVSGSLTYGSNVKEVTAAISEGAADCGIIYASDAYVANLAVIDEASEELCGRVVYPAAILKSSPHQKQANDFLLYLQSPEAAAEFEKVLFTPLTK